MLTPQDKEEVKEIVIQVIKDVVMPAFDTITLSLEKITTRLDQIDRKLDLVTAKTLALDQKFNNHEQRIKLSETNSPST